MTLGKIIKTVATRRQSLGLNCTKFNFGAALPQTPLGELKHSPKSPVAMGVPTSNGREREGKGRGGGYLSEKAGQEREGEGKKERKVNGRGWRSSVKEG